MMQIETEKRLNEQRNKGADPFAGVSAKGVKWIVGGLLAAGFAIAAAKGDQITLDIASPQDLETHITQQDIHPAATPFQ